MLRFIEKKNWRKNVEKCWKESEELTQCIQKSPSFLKADGKSQNYLTYISGKLFVNHYITHWISGIEHKDVELLTNKSSSLFSGENNFYATIDLDCNIGRLAECCKNTFNLTNLQGDYEDASQTLIDWKKK